MADIYGSLSTAALRHLRQMRVLEDSIPVAPTRPLEIRRLQCRLLVAEARFSLAQFTSIGIESVEDMNTYISEILLTGCCKIDIFILAGASLETQNIIKQMARENNINITVPSGGMIPWWLSPDSNLNIPAQEQVVGAQPLDAAAQVETMGAARTIRGVAAPGAPAVRLLRPQALQQQTMLRQAATTTTLEAAMQQQAMQQQIMQLKIMQQQAMLRQAATGQAATGQAETGQAETGQAATGQAATGQVETGQAETGQAATGQVETGQAATGQAATGQATTGQATTGQATTGQATMLEALIKATRGVTTYK